LKSLRQLWRSTVPQLVRRAIARLRARSIKYVEVLRPDVADKAVTSIKDAAAIAKLEVFVGGSVDQRPRLNFLDETASDVATLLPRLAKTNGWRLVTQYGLASPEDIALGKSIDVLVVVDRANDVTFATIVEIAFWSRREVMGRERWFSGRPAAHASSLPLDADRAFGDLSRLKRGYADPLSIEFPIDVVYTWVDDSDLKWATERDKDAAAWGRPQTAGARALHSERFRNRDELRYSLRSLDMFAPWVRKIYLVTADQTPAWLDTNISRLQVVSHREIYRHADALPTFNSSGIETQLHHIPELSEHFLYFNDDVFLGRPAKPTDFFTPAGAAKFFPSDGHAVPEHIDDQAEEYIVADKNAILMFRRDFSMSPSALMYHTPLTAIRSVLDEMEQRYQREFDACEQSKFRSSDDLRPIAFMFPYYAGMNLKAVPSSIAFEYVSLRRRKLASLLTNLETERNVAAFCLNDAGVPEESAAEVDQLVRSFLDRYFPIPSQYERPTG
jgi:hypothetical protein